MKSKSFFYAFCLFDLLKYKKFDLENTKEKENLK